MNSISFFILSGAITLFMVLFSLRRDASAYIHRGIMVVLFASLLPISFAGFQFLQGEPRKANHLTLLDFAMGKAHGDAELIGAQIIEGKGIYLTIAINGLGEPAVYYELGWSEKRAQKLKKAQQRAERDETSVMVNMDKLASDSGDDSGDGDDDETGDKADGRSQQGAEGTKTGMEYTQGWEDSKTPMFYARPQPESALKQIPSPNANAIAPDTGSPFTYRNGQGDVVDENNKVLNPSTPAPGPL